MTRMENNSVLGIWSCASTTMRQPPLVNRRSSVNRLVNRQPVDGESGSHRTASSANQSAIFALSAENSKILRTFAHFLLPEGTGEA